MNHFTKALIIILLALPTFGLAQSNWQDVIYLKDGSIYKGVIIEQVPNVSYKIESADGNVYALQVDQVEKITKEKSEPQSHQRGHWGHWKNDTTTYEPRKRGYFMEMQVLIENVQGGFRAVNGYKFGRFGYLGIGVGVDRVFSNPFNSRVNGLNRRELAGVYLPLYLFHAGDGPRKGRMGMFYAVEAGYAMAFRGWRGSDRNVDDFGNRLKGGPIGGVGLGFKVHNRRNKGHFSLLFNVNYKQVNYERDHLYFSQNGDLMGVATFKEVGHLIIPGIRLGIGF